MGWFNTPQLGISGGCSLHVPHQNCCSYKAEAAEVANAAGGFLGLFLDLADTCQRRVAQSQLLVHKGESKEETGRVEAC